MPDEAPLCLNEQEHAKFHKHFAILSMRLGIGDYLGDPHNVNSVVRKIGEDMSRVIQAESRLIVTMQQLNLHGLLIEIKSALGRS